MLLDLPNDENADDVLAALSGEAIFADVFVVRDDFTVEYAGTNNS